jgi:hypothetical protein
MVASLWPCAILKVVRFNAPYALPALDPSRVIHDPVWLGDHVSRGQFCNLFAQEVQAIGKAVQHRFHCHSTRPFRY